MHDRQKLTSEELKKFGIIMAAMIMLMFGIVIPLLFDKSFFSIWVIVIAAIFASTALIIPKLLQPVYVYWMRFALIMGKINTFLILGLIFFILFTPIALFMKLIKRDLLARSFNPSVDTYRQDSAHRPAEQMEKPF